MKEISSLKGGSAQKKAFTPSLKHTNTESKKTDLHPLCAGLITFILFVLALISFQKYPFAEDAFLISDLEAQYAPFLALLRNKILELGTVPKEQLLSYLTYSFQLGLGKNFAGTVGYYLASPFNLIYLFIDESQIDLAVLSIIVSKLSLASGFMCLFLEKRFQDKKTIWPVALGIIYAFSSYARLYIMNIMWLDGYMLLPLILYFTEKFIKKQKYAGLIVSLLVLFISNYYIAYMAGIACFLYLCIRQFEQETPIKKAAGVCVRYVLTAGFTGMITAFLLVPVGLDTIKNADQTISSYNSYLITYSPLSFIHMMLLGDPRDFNEVLSGNYPLLFISLAVTLMLFIYFFSPVFKSREKKVHAFCVLGVFLSTIVYVIDTAWQVFDEPNWFLHRHTFAFLPLFLIISYRVLEKLKDVARKDIIKPMLIMYLLVAIDYTFYASGEVSEKNDILVYSILLITAYSGVFMGFGLGKWPDQLRDMPKMLPPLLAGILCFETVFVGPMMTSAVDALTLRRGSANEYSASIKAEKEFGDYARNNNAGSGAFRAETVKTTDYTVEYYTEYGEAFYGNYNGLSFFNSSSNKRMHHFLKQLGLATNYNYFSVWHSYTCPSVEAFFSIGSLSSREELDMYDLKGEDTVGTGLKFYSNENALPLGFAADKGSFDFDFYRNERQTKEKDFFTLQNDWYRSLFPDQFPEDIFIKIGEDVTGEPTIFNGVTLNLHEYTTNRYLESISRNSDSSESEETEIGTGTESVDPLGLEKTVQNELKNNLTDIYRTNSEVPIIMEYEFKAPSDGEIYCSVATGRIMDATDVFVNGVKVANIDSGTYYSRIVRLGNFKEGEDVKVTFWSDRDKWSYLNIGFASFDIETFSRQFAEVDKTKVKTDFVTDGYAKFSISGLDTDETVITTIPAEDGWQLYIDGAPAEFKTYQDAFLSFDAPSGDHTAELVFTAPGIKAGAAISCAGVVFLAAFIFVDKSLSKKKKTIAGPAA